MYAIAAKNVVTLWEKASKTMELDGNLCSAISDEALYGTGLAITGEAENGFYPVRTHYNYNGYVKAEEVLQVSLEELQDWEASHLMVVSGLYVDITSLPDVQGIVLMGLFRGALVKVLAFDCEEKEGWAKVELADHRVGYMRNQFLTEKKYSQAGLWEEVLPQSFLEQYYAAAENAEKEGQAAAENGRQIDVAASEGCKSEMIREKERNNGADADQADTCVKYLETQFRDAVVCTAMTYLGVQYRWGGKSTAGIDCSGLTSSSYMQNGVLTYRDAKIVEGFPVHEIPREQMKKGDLLYFPGHIAMCIGGSRYIHSTGKIGSGGVVINSLDPKDEDYREDLVKILYAVGSIF